jgi:tRNA (guanosine-2'-O-)-methyltransferase
VQVLVEDVQKIHNAYAVLRSAECLGIQHVHFSRLSPGKEKVAPGIVKGSHKWVDVHVVQGDQSLDYSEYLDNLKNQGFRLIAAEPSNQSLPLEQVPIDKPMVLLFGTENFGLSELAKSHADIHYHIPMVGFTESLNVSVSAALSLREILVRLKNSTYPWRLPEEERKYTLAKWMISDVHKPQVHLRKVLQRTIS